MSCQQKDEWLGKKAKDKVTGFEGIITAKVIYLYGCANTALPQPRKTGRWEILAILMKAALKFLGRALPPKR